LTGVKCRSAGQKPGGKVEALALRGRGASSFGLVARRAMATLLRSRLGDAPILQSRARKQAVTSRLGSDFKRRSNSVFRINKPIIVSLRRSRYHRIVAGDSP
jgi:hypothetical protein